MRIQGPSPGLKCLAMTASLPTPLTTLYPLVRMDQSHYSESCHLAYNGLGSSPRSYTTDFNIESHPFFDQYAFNYAPANPPRMPPVQFAAAYDPSVLPVQDDGHQVLAVWPIVRFPCLFIYLLAQRPGTPDHFREHDHSARRSTGSTDPVLTETARECGPFVSDESGPAGVFSIQPQVAPSWRCPPHESADEICSSGPIRHMQKRLYRPASRILRAKATASGNAHGPANAARSLRRSTGLPETTQSSQAPASSSSLSTVWKGSVSPMR